ncbi:hypothetical protein BDW62DRAFT_179742 [Aspergillus aurantiobrunneus]
MRIFQRILTASYMETKAIYKPPISKHPRFVPEWLDGLETSYVCRVPKYAFAMVGCCCLSTQVTTITARFATKQPLPPRLFPVYQGQSASTKEKIRTDRETASPWPEQVNVSFPRKHDGLTGRLSFIIWFLAVSA